MILKVTKLNDNATIPTRHFNDDAGLDLYALEDTFIPVGKTATIRTGVAIEIPKGHVGKIEDRSSMAFKGLRVGAGVIDPGFTGHLAVVLHNLNHQGDLNIGLPGYKVRRGDKIAQLLLLETKSYELTVVDALNDATDRATSGFGSSGR